jgi:hypothetical protein
VTVAKRWEDGDALVLRCLETAGAATEAHIALPFWNRSFDVLFGPWELKTLLVHPDNDDEPREVSLLEWDSDAD